MFSLKRNWSKYLNEAHCSVPNLFHIEWPKTEKAREPAVEKSGTRNLEAESIRSRAANRLYIHIHEH